MSFLSFQLPSPTTTISLDSPLSLYALPILYMTVLVPHAQKGNLIFKHLRTVPNVNPRANVELCKQKDIPAHDLQKIERMGAAHSNGFEGFPLWAASILSANLCGVDNKTINILVAYLLFARIFYNYLYIGNDCNNNKMAAARTITWMTTIATCFTLLIKSANALAALRA